MSDTPTHPSVPLSVLDLAPVGRGRRPPTRCTIRSSWCRRPSGSATAGTGSPSTTTCPASPARRRRCCSRTSRRSRRRSALGSGGVMLPNHSAARRGRAVRDARGAAPGPHRPRHRTRTGHRSTHRRRAAPRSRAARRRRLPRADDRAARLLRGLVPRGPPLRAHHRGPARGYKPALWLLGSSTYGASAAAVLGLPYSFAYHFAPAMLDDALAVYRRNFRPSAELDAALRDARRDAWSAARPTSTRTGSRSRASSRSSASARAAPTCIRRRRRPRSTTSRPRAPVRGRLDALTRRR